MAVGDTSVFSAIDDALWSALEDTTVSQGANVDAWRREQSQSGTHRGTNFRSGEIPSLDNWKKTDFPALIVNSGGIGALRDPEERGVRAFSYPVEIIGAIAASREHYTTMKKLRRYAELVMRLLILKADTCFGLASTVVDEVTFVGIEFVPLLESEDAAVPAFVLGMEFGARISMA